MTKGWWAAGNDWLTKKAEHHFEMWRLTPQGKKWARGSRKKSPYDCGYQQPDWMQDARDALAKNDEEGFKAIKLREL